jgi:hypothetical protein
MSMTQEKILTPEAKADLLKLYRRAYECVGNEDNLTLLRELSSDFPLRQSCTATTGTAEKKRMAAALGMYVPP